MVLRADEVLEFASRHATYTTSGEREESLRLHLGVLSRPFGWLTKGIWFLCQALLIAWATLAIYYSNLPWAGVRLALAAAFAACAIWALWLSRQRRTSLLFIVLFLGVVAWWISIPPSHDREWRPEVAVMPRAVIDGDTRAHHRCPQFRLPQPERFHGAL